MVLHRTDGPSNSCSIAPGLNGTGFLGVDSMWRQRSSSFLLKSAEEELLLALLGTMIWHKFSDERLGMALAMHASGLWGKGRLPQTFVPLMPLALLDSPHCDSSLPCLCLASYMYMFMYM